MEVCCKSVFFVSEWVSLELGLHFFSLCNGSTATVFFESKLFEGKYEPRCVQLICCFHNWFMTWLKWRNALPPVYPAGTVVRRSITSCPVQRIPFHAYNFHESQIALLPEGNFCKIQTDAMLSICMCVTEFDIVLGIQPENRQEQDVIYYFKI